MGSVSEAAGTTAFLMVVQGSLTCAMRVADVAEVLRPLPIQGLAGLPGFVIGLSVVRGQPLPVVDFGVLLGGSPGMVGRFVVLKLGERRAVLAVEGVLGVRRLAPEALGQVPPLVGEANPDLIAGIARLDQKLFVALEVARIVPQTVWERLAEEAQVPS